MANVIGTFTEKTRSNFATPVTFSVYDNYTYTIDSWKNNRFAELKIENDNVYIKHYEEIKFVKIEPTVPHYLEFIENVLMIVAENEMLKDN